MPQYVVCPSVCLTRSPLHWRSGPTGTLSKLGWNRVGVMGTKTCNISETVQDGTKVTITN